MAVQVPAGIILIDKPAGITSFGVVYRVRRILGEKKVGHAGTLDPLATGLMLVGVGRGTKALTALVKLDKEYVAQILIGQQRSTGDLEGEVVAEREVLVSVSVEALKNILQGMVGTLTLSVSAYSAIKRDGVPMYKRARAAQKAGTVVENVPVREMKVDAAELITVNTIIYDSISNLFTVSPEPQPVEFNEQITPPISKIFQLVTVRFAVGSGTYIRSLAEELGARIGYPATLYHLRRTKVGEFDVKEAITLDALAAA